MRGKLVSENIRFDRSGDPKKGMDVGLRGDKDTPRIGWITYYDPKTRKEHGLDKEEGEMFLIELMEGKIKDPHFYALIGESPAKTYNLFQYPPKGLLNTPFIYNGEIYTIPEEILYESVRFERGKDPKKSMNIGRAQILKRIDNWVTPEGQRSYYTAIDDGDYRGATVVIYKSIDASKDHYVSVFMDPEAKWGIFSDGSFKDSPEEAWEDAKERIDGRRHREETGYWEAAGIPFKESVNFERGKDPREIMGVGIESMLKKRSLANLVGPASNSKRIAAEIGGEFMYDIDLSKIFLLTKSDTPHTRLSSFFDQKMWDALEPHLSEYNIKHTRSTGAGVDTTIYETPYGKVVREHNNIGVDQYWGERDTYLRLLNSVNESVSFERGKDPMDALDIGRDKLKRRLISAAKEYAHENIPIHYLPTEKQYEDFANHTLKVIERGFDPEYVFEDIGGWFDEWRDEQEIDEAQNFKRGNDPRKTMGIGIDEKIHQWFDDTFPTFKPEYEIAEDKTISVYEFDVPDTDIGEFPEYINFSHCNGDFHVDYCGLTSLRGCPDEVDGFFSCEGNKLTSLDGMPEIVEGDIFVRDNPGKFTRKDVEAQLKFKNPDQQIYSENSLVNEIMRAKYVYEAVSFKRMGPDAGKSAIAGAMGIGHEGAKFDFGKYKGMSAYEVFEEDPQYILWLAGGGMQPRNEKQRKVFEVVKELEKQYYEDIEKQGWEYYGSPGEKFETVVKVDYVRYVSGDYGAAYTIQANDGKHKFRFYYNYNKAEKMAPPPADPEYPHNYVGDFMNSLIGKEIRIKGKVKYHKEYKGYPWTNLNYVTILEVLD